VTVDTRFQPQIISFAKNSGTASEPYAGGESNLVYIFYFSRARARHLRMQKWGVSRRQF
jgi:hypothetical protein